MKQTTHRLPLVPIIAFMLGASLQAAPVESPPRLLVKWRNGPDSHAAATGNAAVGSRVKQNFKAIGWQLVELPRGRSVRDGLKAYQALGSVAAVELDGWLPDAYNDVTPNDPRYGSQWYLPRIGASRAWDTTTGNSNIVVAVVDGGVDYTHPDLAPNMWRNPGETGVDANGNDKATNGIDDDSNGYVDDVHGIDTYTRTGNPMDVSPVSTSHGTGLAGIIGAVGNNGYGVAGVNWSVRIMAILSRGFLSDLLAGWDYMLTMKRRGVNLRVTNNSYGYPFYSLAWRDAINAAGDEGILNVCAAGNFTLNEDFFAYFPGGIHLKSAITVTASAESDSLASFADFGSSTIHLAAPGNNIVSPGIGGTYTTNSGGSRACPMVAGAAALLLSVNPNLTVDELKAALFGSVDQPAALRGKVVTHGRLNVARALEYLTNANPPAIVVTAFPAGQRTATNVPIEVTFNRPMNRTSVESAFILTPPVSGSFVWSADSRSFEFRHDVPFNAATNYTVRILGTARDETGATLDGDFDRAREGTPADDFVWTFRFPVPNDDLANAQVLSGPSGLTQGTTLYTTWEFGEPHDEPWLYYRASVWYRWTPPEPGGWFTFDLTSGNAFDSELFIYAGDRLDSLVEVAGGDNYGPRQTSRVSFPAVAGTTYSITVAGKNAWQPNLPANQGMFTLTWDATPAPILTGFSPTSAYPGQIITFNGTNFTGATRVLFNGVPAQFTVSTNVAFTDLQLTATVPADATTGPITIETPHGTFTTTGNFTALPLPRLAIRPLPGTNLVELSWPSTTGFNLQRADALTAPTAWAAASIVSTWLTNGIRYVTVTNALPNRFFRLYRP